MVEMGEAVVAEGRRMRVRGDGKSGLLSVKFEQ